ncbi:MAG: alkaline phytoceramidase [Betaproteobacteria bacterium]|nr:alkaline phytoceramidase [Betaproteobacteria bacterium]
MLLVAALAAMAMLPPLPEPQVFRQLADDRTFLGIANLFNVASNVPLLLIGTWGLHFVWRGEPRQRDAFADPIERWPYLLCFLGIALTSLGSAYYHLAPDSARLVWDRLPMAIGFMSLLSATVVDRINARAGLRLLLPLLLIGVGSVVVWRWSQLGGAENILPYAVVQYGSIAAILAIAMVFPSRYTHGAKIFGVAATYGAAKMAEILDAQIYALGQFVSGHTLKHLIAAIAVYWLLGMLRLRSPK